MILTCPRCDAQFLVDSAMIPPEGRTVRCASCKHKWHAQPEAVAELTAAPDTSEVEALLGLEQKPEIRAYPEPELAPKDEPEDDAGDADASIRNPEDDYGDDLSQFGRSEQKPSSSWRSDEPEDEPAFSYADSQFTISPAPQENSAAHKASLKPLALLAAALFIAVLITAFLALPASMQPLFGGVYAMIGAHSSEGLELREIAIRQRPSRSKARFVVEGVILNQSEEQRHVPVVRIAMIATDGSMLMSREYSADEPAIIAPGERFPFKASNIETSFGDRIDYLVVDLGNGSELRLRKPTDGSPNG